MKYVIVLLLFWDSLLWAQKVDVGFDKQTDFHQFKSYAWTQREIPSNRPFLANHIMGVIDEELAKKGLKEQPSNPDLLVTCRGGMDVQAGFAATDPTYSASGGYPPPDTTVWSGSLPETPSAQVHQGRLTIDLVDAKNKRLVWQAKVKTNLDYEHKEKALDQVNKAIERMFHKYPPAKD